MQVLRLYLRARFFTAHIWTYSLAERQTSLGPVKLAREIWGCVQAATRPSHCCRSRWQRHYQGVLFSCYSGRQTPQVFQQLD